MTIIEGGAIHDSKYCTIRVLFASTYTAKQLKPSIISLNQRFMLPSPIDMPIKIELLI